MTPIVDPTTLVVVQSVLEQPNVIMTLGANGDIPISR